MSKYQTIRAILSELDHLNREIDLKIIKGFSYVRESKRHRALMSQLNRLSPRVGLFGRMFRSVSMLLF